MNKRIKKKNFLIINEGYSDNLGDKAINDSLQYLLKSNGAENIDFQDFTKNIDNSINSSRDNNIKNNQSFILTIFKRIIPSKIKWLLKNINRVIKTSKKDYDLIIIGGGQLILSNATFSIAMFLWIFFLNLYGNKNIVLFAVGSGTKFNFIDNFLYKYILNKVSKIYVRDKQSQIILKEIFDINSNLVYDVAFIHNKIKEGKNIQKENILLGIISIDVYNRYNTLTLTKEEFFQSWIQLLKNNHIKLNNVKLFYTTQEDKNTSLEFSQYVKNKYNIKLQLLETHTKEILIQELDRAKIVISARMHALILALTYNSEIITYKVSNKLKIFDEMFGKNDFNLIDIQKDIKLKINGIIND